MFSVAHVNMFTHYSSTIQPTPNTHTHTHTQVKDCLKPYVGTGELTVVIVYSVSMTMWRIKVTKV